MKKFEDTSELENYIEDISENLHYVQEKISETQQNVMEIEESQDNNEAMNIQEIVSSVSNIDEAKYLIKKLFNMTLSNSHVVAQTDAKLKQSEAVVNELKQENTVKGQLLDHVLHSDHLLLASKISSSSQTNTGSNSSSRSGSPIDVQLNIMESSTQSNNKAKVRRRLAAPSEMLFGLHVDQDSNMVHNENRLS